MRVTNLITAVDAHAAGEHGRVIIGGVVDVPGDTVLEKMKWLRGQGDGLRRRMLREPRGFPAANCNLIVPSSHPEADAGFIIMEQTEYPGMSGTNTICVATVLLETGMLPMEEPTTELVLEAPAGLIQIQAEVSNGKVTRVTFENVPAFAVHLDEKLEVPELGEVSVDVAYGGMFYVLADAQRLGVQLRPEEGGRIVRVTEMIKAAAREQLPVIHPEEPEFSGVTIGLLSGPASRAGIHSRNAVTVSTGTLDWDRPETWTGALDRSPCGTGTCARMAVLHAKGQLGLNEAFHHEGILGTVFTGELIRETRVGQYAAVVPTLSGQAWITAICQDVLDPSDPFPEGFTIGDIWA